MESALTTGVVDNIQDIPLDTLLEVCRTLEYLESSIGYTFDCEAGEIAPLSLTEPSVALKAYETLTLGYDEDFVSEVKGALGRECNEDAESVRESLVYDGIIELGDYQDRTFYLDDIVEQIAVIEQEMTKENIDISNVVEDTEKVYTEKRLANELYHVDDELYRDQLAEQEKEEENVPVEIVESADGYVKSTGKITAANAAKYGELTKNGMTEVNHGDISVATTTDRAKVSPKVSLETVNALGSIEKASVDAGHGSVKDVEELLKEDPNYFTDHELDV